jgi:hypothetical protein
LLFKGRPGYFVPQLVSVGSYVFHLPVPIVLTLGDKLYELHVTSLMLTSHRDPTSRVDVQPFRAFRIAADMAGLVAVRSWTDKTESRYVVLALVAVAQQLESPIGQQLNRVPVSELRIVSRGHACREPLIIDNFSSIVSVDFGALGIVWAWKHGECGRP